MSKYYYTIGEVSNLLDLKPYVIRYWETEFPQLKPHKGHGRNRQYTEENIELLRKIKHMLYEQKFTIEGARQKLKQDKKTRDQLEIDFFATSASDNASTLSAEEKSELAEELKLMKKNITLCLNLIKTRRSE